MKSSARRPRAVLLPLLLACLCAMLTATCGSLRGEGTPRQAWSDAWGPLVPHDTFPADCGLCHRPDRWDVLRTDFAFDHAKETGVPLEGAHARAACLRCHNDFGPVAAFTARGCAGCHADPHRGQLGGTCTQCHDERSWRPGGLVAEHARTRFPLVGAHIAVACELCHVRAPTGEYRGAPVDCATCHRDDVARATSPDHLANGWTTGCERCHTPSTWGGGGFRHDFFPLEGGHARLDCSRCHTGGGIGPLPADCVACHRDDYVRAPNHAALGFPETCEACHTIQTWRGARFDHRFPLRGEHAVDCAVCHTGGNTATFNCLSCHEHRRSRMDDEHREVAGYVYSSPACFNCHPDGDD